MSKWEQIKTSLGFHYRKGSRTRPSIFRPRGVYNFIKFMLSRPFSPVRLPYCPITLMFEISTVCNLQCPTCERELFKKEGNTIKEQVGIENMQRLRPILPYLHSIFFVSGLGEPFLNPSFWDINRIAKEYKLLTGYFSNAMLLTDELIEKTFTEGINSVLISMDSHIPSKYEQFKKGASFDTVVTNIKKFAKAKERFPRANFKLGLNFIPRSDNYEEMSDFVDFAKGLGVDFVFFTAMITHCEEEADKSPYLIGTDKMKKVFEETRKRAQSCRLSIRLPEVEVKDIHKNTCMSAWRCMCIFQNGDVAVCPYFRTKRDFYFYVLGGRIVREKRFSDDTIIGNIYKDPVLGIWNYPKALLIRKSLKEGKGIPNPCDTCYFRYELH